MRRRTWWRWRRAPVPTSGRDSRATAPPPCIWRRPGRRFCPPPQAIPTTSCRARRWRRRTCRAPRCWRCRGAGLDGAVEVAAARHRQSAAGLLGNHDHRRTAQRAGGGAGLSLPDGDGADADARCRFAPRPRHDGDVDRGRRGGQAPHEFRLFVFDGTAWVMTQDWSTKTALPGRPPPPTSRIRCWCRCAARGTRRRTSFASPSRSRSGPGRERDAHTESAAPQSPATTVTWTASATGGRHRTSIGLRVGWRGLDGDASVVRGQHRVHLDARVANPHYKVAVQVRSAWNTATNEVAIAQPFAVPAGLSRASSLTSSQRAAPAGHESDVDGSATGGASPYQYQWHLGWLAWTVVRGGPRRPYSHSTPTVANADYSLVVQVRSAWNTGTSELRPASRFRSCRR